MQSTRTDPVKAGVSASTSSAWRVNVQPTLTDAWSHVKASLDGAAAPRSGYRYVLAFVNVRYTGSGSALTWLDLDVEFVAGNGHVYRDTPRLSWSNDQYAAGELFTGATAEFATVVEVPASAIAGGKWRVTDGSDYPSRVSWWSLR